MADLTVTEANVGIGLGAQLLVDVELGEAADRGETVYLKSDKKYWLAQNDDVNEAAVKGVIQIGGSAGDRAVIQTGGIIKPGATLEKGKLYYQSGNAGKLAPYDDLAAADYVTGVYRAISTTEATMEINATGTLL